MSEETPSIAAPEQNAIAKPARLRQEHRAERYTASPLSARSRATWNFRTEQTTSTSTSSQIAVVEQTDEIDGLLVLLQHGRRRWRPDLPSLELIAGMKKADRVALVLGSGHSIGVPLAVAAKRALLPFPPP